MSALAVPVAAAGGACFALGLLTGHRVLAGFGSVLLVVACAVVLV